MGNNLILKSISRIELLEQKKNLNEAVLWLDLLEKRLKGLIEKLRSLAKDASEVWEKLVRLDDEAINSYGIALAENGPVIELLANEQPHERFGKVNLASAYGMTIPKILSIDMNKENTAEYIFPINFASSTEDSAKKFEQLYMELIHYVKDVLPILRLVKEIQLTRRKIMYVEEQYIPEIKNKITELTFNLNQRELEEKIRIRKFRNIKIQN